MVQVLEVSLDPAQPKDAVPRQRRWHFFQAAFVAVYLGIVGDIFTTWLGYARAGTAYEQNPLGEGLIGHLGWFGLAALLTGLCVVCYFSVRVVFARMSLRWAVLINTLMVIIAVVRWLAIVTAVIFLFEPGPHP